MDYFPCNQSNHRNQGFQDNQPCELDIALPANPLQENNHYPIYQNGANLFRIGFCASDYNVF